MLRPKHDHRIRPRSCSRCAHKARSSSAAAPPALTCIETLSRSTVRTVAGAFQQSALDFSERTPGVQSPYPRTSAV
jgi:hypothetical protein